jgi:hypothetical protein
MKIAALPTLGPAAWGGDFPGKLPYSLGGDFTRAEHRMGQRPSYRRGKRLLHRGRGLLRATVGLLLTAAAGTAAADDTQPRIIINDAAFTPDVVDRQPDTRIKQTATGQQPYFWTSISANAPTLEQLRQQGKLPIQHAWRRYVGSVVLESADPGKLEGDIPLDLGTSSLADKLQYEVDHTPTHSFTWRTWSQKGPMSVGSWYVFVKYADGNPVICQVVNGTGVPCVYHLEVGPK